MAESSELRIGIAGPISLDLLDYPRGRPSNLPEGYPAPIIAHFVNGLLKRGHRIAVFTTSKDLEKPRVFDQGQLIAAVSPRYRPRSALSFFRAERRWLNGLMAEYRCDVIWAMWSYEFALAALDSGLPTVVHYHDHAWTILRNNTDAYRFLRWLLNARVTRRAKNRVVNSEYLKEALGRHGRGACVIPNFLPVDPALRELPVAERASFIVTISNGFAGCKNVRRALEAFQGVREQGLCDEYRLIGNQMGPGEEAERYAVAHGVAGGVKFVGAVSYEKALAQIAEARLLVHPALEESFGMTILEAMRAGTPVVAGRASGNVPHLLDMGRCGFLCNICDPRDIEAAVTEAFRQGADAQAKAEAAKARFAQYYNEDRVMERFERYCAHVLDPSLSNTI